MQLAVNPWAWTGSPPEPPAPTLPSPQPAIVESQTPRFTTSQPLSSPAADNRMPTWPGSTYQLNVSSRTYYPLSYIIYLHNNAIRSLAKMPPLPTPPDLDRSKSFAQNLLRNAGILWPEIFDQEFPPENSDGGVRYETINDQYVAEICNWKCQRLLTHAVADYPFFG